MRAALARRAASISSSSSIRFSAGGLVGWMMKTSRPRTFSSILTKISPSAKRRIVTAHNGWPKCCAISSARGRLPVPPRSNSWLRESVRSAIGAQETSRHRARSQGRQYVSRPVTDFFARLRDALAARYRLERELGRGGMAFVFQAWDPKHERWVAIKVLRPELAQALGPERFLREIKVAAGLTHPNILPLYDSGEADG